MQVEESNISFNAHEAPTCFEQIGLPHKFIVKEPETSLQTIDMEFPSLKFLQNSLSTIIK
uniref:Uncharacterized protein n=1 Tax=Arundo donax TaxID=35708 RepID=A0A0A9AMF8_ARUDO